MEIAIVSPYKRRGGPQFAGPGDSALNWYSQKLSAALSAAGSRVSIVAPGSSGDWLVPWQDEHVRVVPSFHRGSLFAPWEIARAVASLDPTIVHLQHELYAYGGVMTALTLPTVLSRLQKAGRKMVATIHGVLPLEKIDRAFVKANGIPAGPTVARRMWRSLIRRLAAATNAIHVHEAAHADWLIGQYGIVDRPISVIPLGVDLPTRRTGKNVAARVKLGLPPDAEIVLFFGYFAGYKGVDNLFEELPDLLNRRPHLHVVIAGSRPARLRHKDDISATALPAAYRARVHSLGFVPDADVPDVFNAADVLLLPYVQVISASGPLSLAMSFDLPALLSESFRRSYPDAPGLFSLEKGSIVRVVDRFFSDETLRLAAVEFFRQLAEERSWTHMAQKLQELYTSLSCESA